MLSVFTQDRAPLSGKGRATSLMLIALSALVGYLTYHAYARTFHFGFVFDDFPTIVKNFYLKMDTHKSMLFAHSRWVSTLWNSWTHHNYGLSQQVLRKQNLVLHLLNASMLFAIFRCLLKRLRSDSFVSERAQLISLVAAALFLLHPAQTQTAIYITQTRLEGLAVTFVLAVIGLFLCAVHARQRILKFALYGLSAAVAICAAGTKEIVIVMPALLVLIDIFFISQGDVRDFFKRLPAHLMIASALYGAFYSFSFSSTVPFSLGNVIKLDAALDNNRGNLLTGSYKEKITALRYCMSQFRVMVHYMSIYFWPSGLSFDYDWRLAQSFWQVDVIGSLLVLVTALFGALALWWRKRALPISFGVLWFFVTVLPRASIVPSAEMACDYKTHLGSIGMMLLLSYLVVVLGHRLAVVAKNLSQQVREWMMQGVVVGLLLAASFHGTVARNAVWETPLRFWGDVLTKAPTKSRVHNNYAVALAQAGRSEEALKHYQLSCTYDADYAEPLINMGSHYQSKGDNATAKLYYDRALKMRHEPHPECFYNVGRIFMEEKNYERAKHFLKTAITLKGHYSRARYALAMVYHEEGNVEGAFEELGGALQGDMTTPQVYFFYGKCAFKLGKFDVGIPALEHALKHGYDQEGMFMLGNAYYQQHNYAKAAEKFACVHRRDPENVGSMHNYAQALMQSGNYRKALGLFKKCTGDLKRFPYVPLHIVKCMAKAGKPAEALSSLDHFLEEKLPDQIRTCAILLKKEIKQA